MRKVRIIASNIFDFQASRFNIGGVQTYLLDLANLLTDEGFKVELFQPHDENTSFEYKGINIWGVKLKSSIFRSINQMLFRRVKSKSGANDLIIISTDQMDIKSHDKNSIVIQHGIAFDYPKSNMSCALMQYDISFTFIKLLRSLKNVLRFRNIKNTVCVDYNFFNWYRTISEIPLTSKFKVIPNYASNSISFHELESKLEKASRRKILFARRFVDYRGTKVYANVVEKLLLKYSDIEFAFAGDGPLKGYLEEKFESDSRVEIFSFSPSESVSVHSNYDIAVVPTIFSEGTSLSLCEASSAGCFPIATHVGGMTNMIIDGYNGYLVYPSQKEIYKAIERTLDLTESEYSSIVRNAWEVANCSFSKRIWEKRWLEFINNI